MTKKKTTAAAEPDTVELTHPAGGRLTTSTDTVPVYASQGWRRADEPPATPVDDVVDEVAD